MNGNYQDALALIEDSDQLQKTNSKQDEESSKLKVQTLADNLILGDKLTQKTTLSMNKASILLCAGDLHGAKQQLDKLLADEDLNLITDA